MPNDIPQNVDDVYFGLQHNIISHEKIDAYHKKTNKPNGPLCTYDMDFLIKSQQYTQLCRI